MKRIFVTGLTGLVGSGFLHYLVNNNYNTSSFVVLAREKSDISTVEKYCTVERASSFNKDALNIIFKKYDFDTIIHISNKSQIVQFAQLAADYGIKKYIAISSTYACSQKHKDNVMLKYEKEAISILDSNKIDYIFIRPTSIFGTRPNGIRDKNISIFTNYIRQYPLFPLFKRGKASVRPVWGRDVGLALYISFSHFYELKNNCYIVSGDKERTFKELISLMGRLNNKKVHFLYLPGWLGYFIFYSIYILSFGKIDKREPISRLMEDKAFDSSKELINYGYSPHSFDESYKTNKVFMPSVKKDG